MKVIKLSEHKKIKYRVHKIKASGRGFALIKFALILCRQFNMIPYFYVVRYLVPTSMSACLQFNTLIKNSTRYSVVQNENIKFTCDIHIIECIVGLQVTGQLINLAEVSRRTA